MGIKIGVLGAGTWGMALSRLLANKGMDVTVWSAIEKEIETYSRDRVHPNLPGMVIPESIRFTGDIENVCKEKDLIVFAVPSVFVRATAAKASPFIPKSQMIVDVAKGMEEGTLFTMTEVIDDEIGKDRQLRLIALSGPTHAEEVALDLPTTIVSASKDTEAAKKVQEIFMTPVLRVYTNSDIKGVELCGAMKNVMALAAGISNGLGNGDNTKAAIITRGMAEITRLGLAMGCAKETFAGLAGIGDLIVTATSQHSRNNRCGMLLGQGVGAEEAKARIGMVVEGINALPAAMELSKKYSVDLPIARGVNAIVNEGADPKKVMKELMGRDAKPEFFWAQG
ncbi:MAG: NAD(P)-dependent glycerol-3-phosphate dehydrogenase [Lachnospiraceae bacterium]|nr:NAD(P)-dependent glycerol-3-phosphate dehydrogenase [Lachnospiraceae bacterium]